MSKQWFVVHAYSNYEMKVREALKERIERFGLEEHFGEIMDYKFTANVEKEFDVISEGGMEYSKMLGKFYHPFHDNVEDTKENAKRASGERILGKDPESGRTLLVRMSRFGKPVAQIGKTDELEEGENLNMLTLGQGRL